MKLDKHIKDSLYINEDKYTLEIYFEYFSETDTNYSELDIYKVILNNCIDITNLYFDYFDNDDIKELIQENFNL